MIPFPSRDPALGALDVVLSSSDISEMLEQYLPDCASGAFRVETCLLSGVRYKPGKYCSARYRLALRDTETGSTVWTVAHVSMHRAERAEKLWSDPLLNQLVERAARLHPDPPVGRAAYVPRMQAIVQLYPVNMELPALVCAASSSEMRRVLREALPEGIGSALRECRVELVRYKSKRATLRYRLREAEVDTVYGKLRRDDRGTALFEIGRALIEAGVPTPAPLAYLPELRMLVHAEAPGTLLSGLRESTEFEAWLAPVAETLAHLHATRVVGLPAHSPRHGAEGVLAAGRAIGTALTDLAAEVDRLATSLAADLAAVTGPKATIHGDFSDNQVLVSDAGVALLDLDEVRLDNPLFDVGTFLARLQAHPKESPGAADEARAIFLEAYVALRPDAREHIPLFEAAALLRRWAAFPLRRPRPGWSDEIERLVRLTSQRLREYRRHGRSTTVGF